MKHTEMVRSDERNFKLKVYEIAIDRLTRTTSTYHWQTYILHVRFNHNVDPRRLNDISRVSCVFVYSFSVIVRFSVCDTVTRETFYSFL